MTDRQELTDSEIIGHIEDPQLCLQIMKVLGEDGSGVLDFRPRIEGMRLVIDVMTERT